MIDESDVERSWDVLQVNLEQIPIQLAHWLQEQGIQTAAAEVYWASCNRIIWLLPLVKAMRRYPGLVRFYPSSHSSTLRLSPYPLHKDSDITYDLTPAFPIWGCALSAERFCAKYYTPMEGTRGGWQHKVVAEGDAAEIASFMAQQVEATGFTNAQSPVESGT